MSDSLETITVIKPQHHWISASLNPSLGVQIQIIVFVPSWHRRRLVACCPLIFTHGAFLLASCFHLNQTFLFLFLFFVTKQSHPMVNTTTTNATTTIQCCNVVKVALVASAWIQEISRTDVSLPLIEQQKKSTKLYFMDC